MKRTLCIQGKPMEYTLVQQNRCSVRFSALPGDRTRVYAPRDMRLKDVDALVRARAEDIGRLHAALGEAERARREAHPMAEGSVVRLGGQAYTLRFEEGARGGVREAEDGVLLLTAPSGAEEEARRDILRAYCIERARAQMLRRLEAFAPRIGRSPQRVSIREQKTRWGSCTGGGHISLNWKLITAPPEALDYVVIHELCHLLVLNHSPRFWQLVEAQMPEYTYWRTWLRRYGDTLGV